MAELVRLEMVDDGGFWRVTFGAGKGNILDRETMKALGRVFHQARTAPTLKGICLAGAGSDFSFGASVQEHLPGDVPAMLADFRRLVLDLMESGVPVTAAVRGQCLGGGLELASVCHRIFASADARLGQPEIALGAFAPIASIVLPARIGRAHGEDLCLTGRLISAAEAKTMGLVDEIAVDPAEAALAWMRRHLAGRSASSLRFAVRAVRADLANRIRTELPELEASYVDGLMSTRDAVEGLTAFLEKRRPAWRNE